MTLGHKGTVAACTFRQKSLTFLFVVCNLGSACVHVYTVCVNPAIAGKSNKPLLSRQLVTGSSCSTLLMMTCAVLQAEVVFAMEILLAILGVAEFAFCLWGSVICCATGGCCAPSQPTVYVVS